MCGRHHVQPNLRWRWRADVMRRRLGRWDWNRNRPNLRWRRSIGFRLRKRDRVHEHVIRGSGQYRPNLRWRRRWRQYRSSRRWERRRRHYRPNLRWRRRRRHRTNRVRIDPDFGSHSCPGIDQIGGAEHRVRHGVDHRTAAAALPSSCRSRRLSAWLGSLT